MEEIFEGVFSASLLIRESIVVTLSRMGIDALRFQWLITAGHFVFSLLIAIAGMMLMKGIARWLIIPAISRSKNRLGAALIESKAITWLIRTGMLAIFYFLYPAIFDSAQPLSVFIKNLLSLALMVPVVSTLLSFLNAINIFYAKKPHAKQRTVAGYVWVIKSLIFISVLFIIIGIIPNRLLGDSQVRGVINEALNAPSLVRQNIIGLFSRLGIDILRFQWAIAIGHFIFSLIIACIGLLLARATVRFFLIPRISRSKNKFDDALFKSKTLTWLVRIVPLAILYVLYPAIFDSDRTLFIFLKNLFALVLIVPIAFTLLSLLSAFNIFYNQQAFAKQRPITGYVQVTKILVVVGALLVISGILFDVSLLGIIGGLGALSAVGLLIFKDPILSLAASMQLTMNDMVRIGDWVEIPAHSVNGTVIDMNLQSIRIQNWNKTIVAVPIYSLIAHSFINWRGMVDAGGRRIKRALNIDMESVKFCSPAMIKKFKGYKILHDYICAKEKEIKAANKARKVTSKSDAPSSRAMTNIGTFRAYAYEYIKNDPRINQDLTLMVRQLAPTMGGIPIEIYCFSKAQEWEEYESIQADIFDHFIAIIPLFGLRIFQNPSGHAIESIGKNIRIP